MFELHKLGRLLLNGNETSVSIRDERIFQQLSVYQHLKNDFIPRSQLILRGNFHAI